MFFFLHHHSPRYMHCLSCTRATSLPFFGCIFALFFFQHRSCIYYLFGPTMDATQATYIVRRAIFRHYMRRAAQKQKRYGPQWRDFFKGIAYLSDDAKRFNICASFLQNYGLIGSQIEGFEYFVDHLYKRSSTRTPTCGWRRPRNAAWIKCRSLPRRCDGQNAGRTTATRTTSTRTRLRFAK